MLRPALAMLAVCLVVAAASGQTVIVRDQHPRLIFTAAGAGGTRTFQDVRDLYNANAGANPFRDEVGSWATGTYDSTNPIVEASRFVVTADLSHAENALSAMASQMLTYGGTESYALQGAEWAMAYDWIHSAWAGSPSPPAGLAATLAGIETQIAGWVDDVLDDLDVPGASLWHGRAATGAAAWVAALALPAGEPAYESLRDRAFGHWQQSLLASHAAGAWPEGPTYWANNRAVNFPLAVMSYSSAVTAAPALAVADPVADLRAMGLWQAYTERGDGTFNRYGDVSSAVAISNGTMGRSLDVYAMATGDPALAAFAQHARQYRMPLYYSGYRWMYAVGYDPTQAKPAGFDPAEPGACLDDALPDAMVFGPDATGLAVIRSGWSDGDTQISFKAGDYLAHHGHYDQGTFTLFKHAPLVINSGGYGPYFGDHRLNYYVRTVSKNGILVQRPDEMWTPSGVAPPGGYVNDGGQRIVNATGSTVTTYDQWLANKTAGTHYESGDVTACDAAEGDYAYIASDITAAYNSTDYDSEGQGGKVSLVTRQLVYLHDADALIVFDRVASTDPSYKTKWLLHTPEKFIGGAEVVAVGAADDGIIEVDGDTILGDTLVMTNGPGRLFCQVLTPSAYTVNKVGGPNYRYYVEDDGNDADGYDGTNHDDYDERAWHDYGDWRIEVSPKAAATFETFLTVLTPRGSDVAEVASAAVVLETPAATVLRLGGRVVGFATAGQIDGPTTYAPGPGAARHLIVDFAPGRFVHVDLPGDDLGLFANDAGALAFDDPAGGADVTLTPTDDPHPGDADLDGWTRLGDLSILAYHWAQDGSWLQGDFTGDGLVNLADLSILAAFWETQAAPPVPEPAGLSLLACGALAGLWRRRRRALPRAG